MSKRKKKTKPTAEAVKSGKVDWKTILAQGLVALTVGLLIEGAKLLLSYLFSG